MENGTRTASHLREGVAEEVRALLARRRLAGAKLAQAIGKSEMYVSRRLRGETAFDLDDLEQIANVLGVAVADLLPQSVLARNSDAVIASAPTLRYADLPERTGARRPIDNRPGGHPTDGLAGPRRTTRVARPGKA